MGLSWLLIVGCWLAVLVWGWPQPAAMGTDRAWWSKQPARPRPASTSTGHSPTAPCPIEAAAASRRARVTSGRAPPAAWQRRRPHLALVGICAVCGAPAVRLKQPARPRHLNDHQPRRYLHPPARSKQPTDHQPTPRRGMHHRRPDGGPGGSPHFSERGARPAMHLRTNQSNEHARGM